jgi:transcriptional regulator with XRE-family HTH domain
MKSITDPENVNPIREWRERHGYTRRDLAKKLGKTSWQAVKTWEEGRNFPSLSALRKLSGVMKVPIPHIYDCIKDGTLIRTEEENDATSEA